jgi:protein SCO1/2
MRISTLALLAMTTIACAKKEEPVVYRGMMLTPPVAKPNYVFTGTDGRPYDFKKETSGKVALLFFGYTNCPDVCPLHMTNLGNVIKQLPARDRERIKVVFVTTDPERDTPERLRTWIRNFDTTFVGVAGKPEDLNKLQMSLGMPPAVKETAPKGSPAGAYGVSHGSAVLAFTPDDSLRTIYPMGIRQEDWTADLPKLLKVKARG